MGWPSKKLLSRLGLHLGLLLYTAVGAKVFQVIRQEPILVNNIIKQNPNNNKATRSIGPCGLGSRMWLKAGVETKRPATRTTENALL